ncbi:MAG: hypothetical protein ACREXP_10415 [Steroidobacteraceae bacterium]
MNRPTDSFSLRTAVEKVFAGIAATVIIAFVSAGTVAMCFPTLA